MSAEENATLLERTAPHITVPSHIVWGQEDQVRFNIIAEGRGFDLYMCIYSQEFKKKIQAIQFIGIHQICLNLHNNQFIDSKK